MRRKLAVILASDVAGYSRLVALDEESTVARFAKLKSSVAGLVESYNGRIFNTAGDAILAEFDSATNAVRCAIEIQDSVRTRNISFPESQKMLLRIGIAIGDVLVQEDDGDLLGDGVNIAARLQTLAQPGGVCVSQEVYSHAGRNLSCTVHDLGDQALKNIPAPVRVFEIQIPGAAPAPAGAPASQASAHPVAGNSQSPAPRSASGIGYLVGGLMVLLAAALGAGVAWLVIGRDAGRAGGAPAVAAGPSTPQPSPSTPPIPTVGTPPLPAPQASPPAAPPQQGGTGAAPPAVQPPPLRLPPLPDVGAPVVAQSPSVPAPAPGFALALAAEFARYGVQLPTPLLSIRAYVEMPSAKSLFIAPGRGAWTPRGWGATATSQREHEDFGFEGCQAQFGVPCVMVAADHAILAETDPRRIPNDSPRLSYTGRFSLAQTPIVSASQRNRPEIVGYASTPGPKAMAIHRDNIARAATGDTIQDAEAKALAECNAARRVDDPNRKCWTYALDMDVVFPLRRTSAAEALPADVISSAVTEQTLLALFEQHKLSYLPATLKRWANNYIAAKEPKALFVATGKGVWTTSGWRDMAEAEIMGLERCNIFFGMPCIQAARNLTYLPSTSPARVVPATSARASYAGNFDLTQIPGMAHSTLERFDIKGYAAMPGPKSMALHPYGRLFVRSGADASEAEANALNACNSDRTSGVPDGPCYTYAVDGQVVLPERRTRAP